MFSLYFSLIYSVGHVSAEHGHLYTVCAGNPFRGHFWTKYQSNIFRVRLSGCGISFIVVCDRNNACSCWLWSTGSTHRRTCPSSSYVHKRCGFNVESGYNRPIISRILIELAMFSIRQMEFFAMQVLHTNPQCDISIAIYDWEFVFSVSKFTNLVWFNLNLW